MRQSGLQRFSRRRGKAHGGEANDSWLPASVSRNFLKAKDGTANRLRIEGGTSRKLRFSDSWGLRLFPLDSTLI